MSRLEHRQLSAPGCGVGGCSGAGRAAWTKMMLKNPFPFLWSRNSEPGQGWRGFVVHSWVALGSGWQGSLVGTKAAQAARLVSSCVLGYAHLWC